MILVDTSVWIDHLRSGDNLLAELLDDMAVLTHPFVIGELAMARLRQRDTILDNIAELPQAIAAADSEVLRLINQQALFGMGIGYIDAHLLTATRLTPGAALWTRDRVLAQAAERLSIAARVTH
jgi:predicted nucleic acid-binding protein